jgi:signal transduction histidine kinase
VSRVSQNDASLSEVSEIRAWRLGIQAASEELASLVGELRTLAERYEPHRLAAVGGSFLQLAELLVEHLADLAEDQRAELSRNFVRAHDLVEQAAHGVYAASENGDRGFHIYVDPEVAVIYADEGKLRRVLRRLLGQASRESVAGGRVGVRVSRADDYCLIAITHERSASESAERALIARVPGEAEAPGWLAQLVALQDGRLWTECEAGVSTTYLSLPDAVVSGATA